MKRSVGITISAVIAFLGSGATLLWGASMFLAVSLARAQASQPRFLRYGTYFLGMLLVGFAAWGIASGVGLLRLREWARISLLLFSGLLLVCSLPALIMFIVMPIPMPPNANNPELFRQTIVGMRVFMGVFNGLLIALSAFWLWFLNTRTTKERFKGVTKANSSEVQYTPPTVEHFIIGWYLLVTAFTFPAVFFLHLPVFLLGFFLKGTGRCSDLVGDVRRPSHHGGRTIEAQSLGSDHLDLLFRTFHIQLVRDNVHSWDSSTLRGSAS